MTYRIIGQSQLLSQLLSQLMNQLLSQLLNQLLSQLTSGQLASKFEPANFKAELRGQFSRCISCPARFTHFLRSSFPFELVTTPPDFSKRSRKCFSKLSYKLWISPQATLEMHEKVGLMMPCITCCFLIHGPLK